MTFYLHFWNLKIWSEVILKIELQQSESTHEKTLYWGGEGSGRWVKLVHSCGTTGKENSGEILIPVQYSFPWEVSGAGLVSATEVLNKEFSTWKHCCGNSAPGVFQRDFLAFKFDKSLEMLP